MGNEMTKNAITVLERRYLKKDENGVVCEEPIDLFRRVADCIADVENEDKREEYREKFLKVMSDLEFMPNSPCLMNAGRPLSQLSACFVLDIPNDVRGIFTSILNTALIHQSGGGTGFNFSKVDLKGNMSKDFRIRVSLNEDHADYGDFIEAKFDNLDKIGRHDEYARDGASVHYIEDCIRSIFDLGVLLDDDRRIDIISFSEVRPKGSKVHTTDGEASGPVSFMRIWDKAIGMMKEENINPISVVKLFDVCTDVIKQGGKRRGANMAIVDIDNPYIAEFISCKKDNNEINNFNISVGINGRFMEAVNRKSFYDLINPNTGKVVRKISAEKVFDTITNMAWRNGEPGIIFFDKVNAVNPLAGCLGWIMATNPCVTGDTLVKTDKGEIRIDELVGKRSVKVYCVDEDGNVVLSKASNIIKTKENAEIVKILRRKGSLRCTPDHLILTKSRGWQKAEDLEVGERIIMPESSESNRVLGVVRLEETEDVYDMTVDIYHNFIANGVVVHNCGEQTLYANESCDLGSINLANHVKWEDGKALVDFNKLANTASIATRFLDNVIDANKYPTTEIEEMSKKTRKIGLGVMGWAEMLYQLGIPYNSDEAVNLAKQVMEKILNSSWDTSVELAEEKGVFPLWGNSWYAENNRKIRNATLTTIAPTGTISIISGCSSGVEPCFGICFVKNVMDNDRLVEVNPYFERIAKEKGFYSGDIMSKIAEEGSIQHIDEIPDDVKRVFVTAHDISAEWHVRMQAAFQEYTHNAVSKTVNLPNNATIEDVRKVYMLAYENDCKGITIYRDGSRDMQVLSTGKSYKKDETGESSGCGKSECDNVSRNKKEANPRHRYNMLPGITCKVRIGCGNLYVTVNFDRHGICEVFTHPGKTGGCHSQSEATCRLASISLRAGVSVDEVVDQIKGIRCNSTIRRQGDDSAIKAMSCPDAIGRLLMQIHEVVRDKESLKDKFLSVYEVIEKRNSEEDGNEEIDEKSRKDAKMEIEISSDNLCPDCGSVLAHVSGCVLCYNCVYSKCN